ncbi:acyl carrier protein [Actinoplanes sp. NBRC 14428]|uniref:Acyl carrier protein n=1 Tax=Pseudosporangium ferrugineum TaxID=439699 RepID=A0A2T0S4R3_9ACTN|nr:acyl carrier protein [Pseudosporangium ferrugineum]PRY28411.1 acyl carrier protein [Pseudosporangium ferrugineum]BCJ53955.1 acyl carrier protein [Actinoplanes sp. NBRC 14428]
MPSDQTAILADVSSMLRTVLGDFGDDAEVTMDTTFRDDLGMESIDVVSLAGRLQARYGNAVNFALFASGLDVESVGELRVGQLVDYIADSLEKVPAGS